MATLIVEDLSGTERLILDILDNPDADAARAPHGLGDAIELLRRIIAAFEQFQAPDAGVEPSPATSVRPRLIFRWSDENELPWLQAHGWSIARRGSYPGSWLLCREDVALAAPKVDGHE